MARRRVERYQATLFPLFRPGLFSNRLTALPCGFSKRDLLQLGARAERRIALTGTETPEEWLTARTDIIMLVGTAARLAKPEKQLRKR